MDLETRVQNCEEYISAIISKLNNDDFYNSADIAGVRKGVTDITPYTETKTAYIGDTEVTFLNTPSGNLTVYFPYEYTVERLTDRIVISFDELQEVTDVTISIL